LGQPDFDESGGGSMDFLVYGEMKAEDLVAIDKQYDQGEGVEYGSIPSEQGEMRKSSFSRKLVLCISPILISMCFRRDVTRTI